MRAGVVHVPYQVGHVRQGGEILLFRVVVLLELRSEEDLAALAQYTNTLYLVILYSDISYISNHMIHNINFA